MDSSDESQSEEDIPMDDDPDDLEDPRDLMDHHGDQEPPGHPGMNEYGLPVQVPDQPPAGLGADQYHQFQNASELAMRYGVLAFFAHRTANVKEWCRALMRTHSCVHTALAEICPDIDLIALHRNIKALPEDPTEFPYPPTYRALYSLAPHTMLDDQFIELIQPGHMLQLELKAFVACADPQSRLASVSRIHFLGPPSDESKSGIELCKARRVLKATAKPDIDNFFQTMQEYVLGIPDCIKRATEKQVLHMNNLLAIYHLNSDLIFPTHNPQSLKMKGMMSVAAQRVSGTFLSPEGLERLSEEEKEILTHITQFLKDHHIFYRGIDDIGTDDIPTNLDYAFRLRSASPLAPVLALGEAPVGHIQPETRSPGLITIYHRVSEQQEGMSVTLTLEEALSAIFPLIFPFGPVLTIPGKSLREKAQLLLLSDPWFRVGKVQDVMILFLFDRILKWENNFHQYHLNIRPQRVPTDVDRTNISRPIVRTAEPCFSPYWEIKQKETSAYCGEFGLPDVMLTFTFGRWPEVITTEAQFRSDLHLPAQTNLHYAPLETMLIWQKRFSFISQKGFQRIANEMGLGTVLHFIWRLEFQVRGFPHVHCLLWLENRLSVDTFSRINVVKPPPDFCSVQWAAVKKHRCSNARCRTANRCKYGFPKPISSTTHLTPEGRIIYRRDPGEEFLVERPPVLTAMWDAHCHLLPLRFGGSDIYDTKGVAYAVKYNLKAEPSLTVQERTEEIGWRDIFRGRVVSVEEAIARIFSFSYIERDTAVVFADIRLPGQRTAIYDRGGDQLHLTPIERYFHRPLELYRLRYLEFMSLFSFITSPTERPTLDPAISSSYSRPPMTLISGSTWETDNLPLDLSHDVYELLQAAEHPSARMTNAIKNRKPSVVSFRKPNPITDQAAWLYMFLLISGAWRSEEEMLAGRGSDYGDAIIYHGIIVPDHDDDSVPVATFISHMITSNRYGDMEIQNYARILFRHEISLSFMVRVAMECPDEYRGQRDVFLDTINALHQARSIEEQEIECVGDLNPDDIRRYVECHFSEDEVASALANFHDHYEKLSTNQREIVDDFIDNRGTARQYAVMGAAGSGKTFLLNTLKSFLISHNFCFVFTASTGIAATLLGGRTVHSAFSICQKGDNYLSNLRITNRQGIAMSNLDFLFVDEVSMLNAKVFNLIDAKLRELKQSRFGSRRGGMPFGGVTIFITGDIGQVPVVVPRSSDMIEATSMFVNMAQFDHFKKVKLTQIQRIDGDADGAQAFMQLLTEARRGREHLSAESLQLLRSRFIRIGNTMQDHQMIRDFVGPDGLVVFYLNRRVDEYNDEVAHMEAIQQNKPMVTIKASFFIESIEHFRANEERLGDLPRCFSMIPATPGQINGYFSARRRGEFSTIVPHSLTLFLGARVMLLKNIDTKEGLVNGRRGTVVEVIMSADVPDSVSAVRITFDRLNDQAEATVPITWMRVDSYQFPDGNTIHVYQIPLRLCYAVTAHKAQGQTLSRVAVSIMDPAFAHGAFYVALSRVRRLSDLMLFGTDEFPEHGPDFHLNRFIQEMEPAFEGLHEF